MIYPKRLRVQTTKITDDIVRLVCIDSTVYNSSFNNIYYYNFKTGSFKPHYQLIRERYCEDFYKKEVDFYYQDAVKRFGDALKKLND